MDKKFVFVLVMLALLSFPALAQDDNLDDLFGEPEATEETNDDDLFGDSFFTEVEEDPDANPADALLSSETVTIGGSFGVSAEVNLALTPEDGEDAFTSGLTDLGTRLFLDARPNSDFRAFVKGDISYETTNGVSFDLREAFADIDVDNQVFIRAGKQTINWGVGLFFSPANLVNLETIDPENPDAELAGPVAVKVQVPIDTNNATGYLLMDDLSSAENIGVAARYEFLLSGYEFTVGGIWRNENPWAVMVTAAGNIQGIDIIEDVAVFAEIVLEGNSNKVFIVEDSGTPLGYSTTTSDDLYVSATVGARASHTTEDDLYTISGAVQYLFNGLGYADTSVFTENPQVIGAFLAQGQLGFNDLTERGQHYLAANVSSPDIANTSFNPSAFWLMSLSDGSGFLNTSVSYSGIEYLTPSLSYRFNYGAEGAEYSPRGSKHSLTLGFDLRGSF